MKNALLLINLGTPSSPETADVRSYLAEFLSDKRVIDLPAVIRYILLYTVILPFRPKQSAKAYQSIWTEHGSPLLCNSQALADKLHLALGHEWQVAVAMRYGQPGIERALDSLAHCDQLYILPLYPQYASASSGSSIEKVFSVLKEQKHQPTIHIISEFYKHPAFIQSLVVIIKPYLSKVEHILFSYHGVPQRQIAKSGCPLCCESACPVIHEANKSCYKAQCYETTRQVVANLGLDETQYSHAFQSRLGKTAWIKPYTDERLIELAKRGIKKIAIACPSFVCDCLETLEEIAIQAQEQWLSLGGESLSLIPCLNDNDTWVDAVIDIVGIKQ